VVLNGIVDDPQPGEVGLKIRLGDVDGMGHVCRHRIEPSSVFGKETRGLRLDSMASVTLGSGDAVFSGANLTPLYSGGLCDAVTMRAPARFRSAIAYATVGVGTSLAVSKNVETVGG
jgi:hypothetical protein